MVKEMGKMLLVNETPAREGAHLLRKPSKN
jgi:hypothetical protein